VAEERKVNREARRVSPRGLITLPPDAQRALGIDEGTTNRVRMDVSADAVRLSRTDDPDVRADPRLSPGGLLQLSAEAHQALTGKRGGRYSVEYGDGSLTLRPAKSAS
jgi:hypothetical protein